MGVNSEERGLIEDEAEYVYGLLTTLMALKSENSQ
jgi:hypothetical protein